MGVGLAILTLRKMYHYQIKIGLAGSQDALLTTRIGVWVIQTMPPTMNTMRIFI